MNFKRNLIAFLIISALGTIGHFIYEWSGNNYYLGFIFPVNESTWEHLKLLFFPAILYFTIAYLKLETKPENYLQASVFSILFGMLVIVTLFYTIRGILGFNVDFVNIGIYYVGVIATLVKRQDILNHNKFDLPIFKYIAVLLLILFTLAFIIWSYKPPTLGIFKNPLIEK